MLTTMAFTLIVAKDWVFASEHVQGRMPPWPDTLLDRVLQPAAKRAGITKWVGFHTFRHTYSTLLKANGEDVKVVQELMRHANISTTMNIYTKALTPAKREAQSRVVDVLMDRSRSASEEAKENAAKSSGVSSAYRADSGKNSNMLI